LSLRQAASPPRERRAILQLCDATGYHSYLLPLHKNLRQHVEPPIIEMIPPLLWEEE